MSLKSTKTRYGTVAISIHWLSAVLILVLLGSGFRAGQTIDPMAKADILRMHVTLGIAILLLTIFRIIWWRWYDVKLEPVGHEPRWQELAAKAVHVLFYIIILGMVASGIGMLLLSGAGAILFGGTDGPLPDFNLYPPRIPHGLGARLIVGLLVLHAGAALYHHFVKHDATLRRMWFDREGKK